MPLTAEEKNHLFHFVGYGPAEPQFIFIGPEEGCGAHVEVNLQARLHHFPEELHDRTASLGQLANQYAAAGLVAESQQYTGAAAPGAEATWTMAAKFLAHLRPIFVGGPPHPWQDEYLSLGNAGSDSLLCELFPLPKRGMGSWPDYYQQEFGFPNQNAYYDAIWPRNTLPGAGACERADLLSGVLAPSLLGPNVTVVAYGRGGRDAEFWARYDALVGPHGPWQEVAPNRSQIARLAHGGVVARVAHPSRNGFSEQDIVATVLAMQALQ